MKNLKLLTLFTLFIGLSFTSCKKDEEKSNYLNFDNDEFDLSQGFYESYGENEDESSFDIDVYLLSEGINVDFVNEKFTGEGHMLYLDFNSSNETKLVDGVYTYSNEREAFTFVDSDAVFNGSASMDFEDGTETYFNAGTIEVKNDGSKTELIFDLTSFDGKSAKGSFKGELKEVF